MAFDKTTAVENLDTWRRQARVFFKRLGRKIDHEAVVDHACEEGQISGRYAFMAVMSCAIATLGLLLSSPAVIIGAMLISPLMGPIMLMGFSLSILDLAALRRAILTMALGVLAAVTISFLIVRLSPLTEITPEIIALIQPLVCVRPDRFQSALNIETLTEEEAPLLIALYSGELSREDAQSVIRAKPLAGWQSLDTFLQNAQIQTIAVAARNDSMLSLKPSNLRLTARIVSGSTQENLQLVYAMDKGGQASLIQRTTGDF